MKNIIIIASACVLFASCDNLQGYFKNTTSSNTAKSDSVSIIKTTTRDLSITPENAYSDLFLDSSAVEAFIKSEKLPDNNAQALRNFYNQRNYQYAWFASDGLTEQGRGVWNLYKGDSTVNNDGKKEKSFEHKMDTLVADDSVHVNSNDSSFAATEIALTQQYLRWNNNNATSLLVSYIPVKKISAVQLADSILKMPNDSAETNGNRALSLLRIELGKYDSITKNGGWQPVAFNHKKISKGTSSPAIKSIKKRLALTGDFTAGDTTNIFNDSLMAAVKNYEQRNGLQADGIISDTVIKALNVPAEKRLKQILINMNRMAWAPPQSANVIEVNIPAYMLHVYENGNKVFDMPVVVGKEGTNTMMFNGNLNQIVFSPYWNVPASIVRDEILPAMKTNPDYLKTKHMEIVSKGDSLPVIRQLPGNDNALGKVKFLFPNSYDIYFHDTPAKGLFDQQKRALSHGCIRLADAQKMAEYLLRNDHEWTPERIMAAMNAGKERYVKLENPMPVAIHYYTAWIDDNGQLNFRDDIYGHDEKTSQKMFTANM